MQLDIEKIQDDQGAIVTIRSENLDAGNVKTFKDRLLPVLEDHQSVL